MEDDTTSSKVFVVFFAMHYVHPRQVNTNRQNTRRFFFIIFAVEKRSTSEEHFSVLNVITCSSFKFKKTENVTKVLGSRLSI